MLLARSSPECHLYIALHPCDCGETEGPTKHRLESRGEDLVAVYDGPCPRCAVPRRFEFALDPEIAPGGKFGGAKASQIIDAGQFLAVADAAARQVPASTSGMDDRERQRARSQMSRAIAALEEVLKFIPEGADSIPGEALFSVAGQALYRSEPGRFRRSRLEAVLRVYLDAASKI